MTESNSISIPLNYEELYILEQCCYVPWVDYSQKLTPNAYAKWQKWQERLHELRKDKVAKELKVSPSDLNFLIQLCENGLKDFIHSADYSILVGRNPEEGRAAIEKLKSYARSAKGTATTHITLTKQRLFYSIREIINTYDPEGFIGFGCPEDEYDDLTGTAATELSKSVSEHELVLRLLEYFKVQYGRDGDKVIFQQISHELIKFTSPEVVRHEAAIASQLASSIGFVRDPWKEYRLSWGDQPSGLYADLRFLAEEIHQLATLRVNEGKYREELEDFFNAIETLLRDSPDDIRRAIDRAFIEHLRDCFSIVEIEHSYLVVKSLLGEDSKKSWEKLEAKYPINPKLTSSGKLDIGSQIGKMGTVTYRKPGAGIDRLILPTRKPFKVLFAFFWFLVSLIVLLFLLNTLGLIH